MIDSHQHFWKYDPAQYPWMTEKLSRLKRDYLPTDLEPLLHAAGLDGCIAVQAKATPSAIRQVFRMVSQSAIRASQGRVAPGPNAGFFTP